MLKWRFLDLAGKREDKFSCSYKYAVIRPATKNREVMIKLHGFVILFLSFTAATGSGDKSFDRKMP